MSLSYVSLDRISLVLRYMQQGVSPRGSAGAILNMGKTRNPKYRENRKNRAHGRHSLLKRCVEQHRENMKPDGGKHETLNWTNFPEVFVYCVSAINRPSADRLV